ncbi:MAG: hypothetical protein ACOY0T_15110 [Myxococcota bacterium]
MRRLFWMSALVAISSWGCSSSSQSSEGMGGVPGSSGGTAGIHSGAGTSGKATNGGIGNSGGTGSSMAGGSATAGDTGNNGGTSSTSGGGSSTAGTGGAIAGAAACDNGKDDDGDGFIDGFDGECTGPLDNDEGTFATGIPGDNRDPKWQDCFFDGNSGAGDDDCRYATGCLTGDLPQTDADCKLTDACVKFCAPLTQNGCDCFGCCTVQLGDGSTVDITENAACSLANIDDTKACPRCVKNTQCGNTCGECELCLGKTVADLPASCTPPTGTGGSGNVAGSTGVGGSDPSSGGAPGAGGTLGAGGSTVNTGGTGGVTWNCDGAQTCGPNLPPCEGSGEYCSFGCCIPAIR